MRDTLCCRYSAQLSNCLQVSHCKSVMKPSRIGCQNQLSDQHYQHNQGRHIEAARKLSKGLRGSKHATNAC